MKIVLDTNAYCLCDTSHPLALEVIEKGKSLFLPAIVYGELYYGFRYGTRFQENLRRLDQFINDFDVEIIEVDREVARRFGDIYAGLRKKGSPIPTNDIWISACCISVGGTLLTADRHFQVVDQIEVQIISNP